ncbi:MAG: 3-dehydroquinate synthase [Marinilabiliales bacterium]|nr:MAG: 3-dehydroquinate synthase [Marinilabiliales bacterium]
MSKHPLLLDTKPVSYMIGNGALDMSEKGLLKYPRIIMLVDENVEKHCLPVFRAHLPDVKIDHVITIKSGERGKNLEQSIHIWDELTRLQVDRDALFLNLGGGVVTDIGGFTASTYKRGIPFINFPTTLLGMADAAIGGKTGIDYGAYKNQVGLFVDPVSVIIDPIFLNTLEDHQWQSGFAEVMKYGLIMDRDLWSILSGQDYHQLEDWDKIITKAARDKIDIVHHDALEKGMRKNLNFGHTIGHAIESYYLMHDKPITHGQAIAAGMICETWISSKIFDIECTQTDEIVEMIDLNFEKFDISEATIPELLDLMRQDKKVREGQLKFSLIRKIGKATHDIEVNMDMVVDSIKYYINRNSVH